MQANKGDGTMRALVGLIGLCVVFALGCAPLAPGFYDAAPIEDPGLANCLWSRRFNPPIVYQESDFIRAYFEPADLAAYRQAIPAPFAVPPRPLVRVSVLDFYEMVNGPLYLESEISVLAFHEGQPGWFVLTMPVTDGDACAGGRNALGTPKVMRRITLERGANQYVGTSYARGGRMPEFTLKIDVGEPGEAARELLRFVSPFPDFYLLRGRVLKFGGLPRSVVELESVAPGVWKVRLGHARLEFPREQESLLHRLGVGPPLAAYWGQMRLRFTITPR
jgi:Acetoacetate decarboxylase (ADC)